MESLLARIETKIWPEQTIIIWFLSVTVTMIALVTFFIFFDFLDGIDD